MTEALEVEIVSDLVCPWCYIGEKRMRDAVTESGLRVNLRFSPFLLDPTTPETGADLRERLRTKYGVDPESMFARVEQAAHASGLLLDFAKVRRTPNTIRAHTLLRHAADRGTQNELAVALFEAYFVRGEDIGDLDVLAHISAHHGFVSDEVRALCVDPAELETTRQHARAQVERGISGVPFFVLGNRFAVSGAQPVEVLGRALRQLATAQEA